MNTKKISSFTLICMLLASIIFGGTDVSAKANKSLKVTYKGKTVALVKNYNVNEYGRSNSVTFAKCEKAWGKAKKKKNNALVSYTWKNKNTKIELSNFDAPAGVVGSISISIKDKRGAIAGVKVGMSKATAIKKLKNIFGPKNVRVSSTAVAGIYGGNGMHISAGFTIKNGKVIGMSAFRS